MKGIVKGLVIGLIIIAVGVVLLLIGLAVNGWRIGKNMDFTAQTFTAEGENTALNINLNAGSLRTEFYDGDRVVIEYPYSTEYVTTITEKGGTVTVTNKLKWYVIFGSSVEIPETVIKLPQSEVFDMTLDIDAGTVNICGGTYGTVSTDLDAGTFKAGELVCKTFRCDLDAGTVNVTSLECELLTCDMNAGTVNLKSIDCPDVRVTLDAGTAKLAFAGTKEEYTITRRVSAGNCNVDSQTGTTGKKISIDLDAGTVNITFGV